MIGNVGLVLIRCSAERSLRYSPFLFLDCTETDDSSASRKHQAFRTRILSATNAKTKDTFPASLPVVCRESVHADHVVMR